MVAMASCYGKTLSPDDVKDKFHVPSNWVGTLFPNLEQDSELPIQVRDQAGSERQFVLKTRRGVYLKTVFQRRGWHKFVRDLDLREGETVYFWKEAVGGRDIMRVQVRDEPQFVQLFGVHLVMPNE
ncbi:hypothetical protein L484_006966 [Morus notabilis]|uniref:TF-B3 domain-containing protein n=1 Tax=Morus notabilis TaxID=981085 RepID=W9RIK6_9ROSA|nr:hypothetical protein L484_006966 [Morus notabilis]